LKKKTYPAKSKSWVIPGNAVGCKPWTWGGWDKSPSVWTIGSEKKKNRAVTELGSLSKEKQRGGRWGSRGRRKFSRPSTPRKNQQGWAGSMGNLKETFLQVILTPAGGKKGRPT